MGRQPSLIQEFPVQLASAPNAPAPANAVVGVVESSGGAKLRFARWRQSTRRCCGTVCIMTGRSEFIEKYGEVVADLSRRGFAVLAFDWRGQGGSDRPLRNRRKGHVDDFEDYQDDLTAIVDGVLRPDCPKPWFALAHSMGGAILLLRLARETGPFERVVITAPMCAIAGLRRPRGARLLAASLDVLGFGGNFIPGGGETAVTTKPFAGNPLTGDPVRYARSADLVAAAPELGLGDPTIGWVHAAFRAMDPFKDPNFPLTIEAPVLMILAGADAVTATPAAERVAARLKAGRAIVIPGALHEILMEREVVQALFWSAFDAFVPGTGAALPDAVDANPDPASGIEAA
jgi:lysophospholipase